MNTVKLPAVLADAVETYYQTRDYSRRHFIKFRKDMVLNAINKAAQRVKYSVEGDSGTFVFTCKSKKLKVTQDSFPMAEKLEIA